MTQAAPAAPTTVPVNGPVLRELRIRSGLSISSLAAAVGVDRSWINKIEVSERDVSPELFDQIARQLAVRDRRVLIRPVGAGQ
jgi:predicted transcriptional regulator